MKGMRWTIIIMLFLSHAARSQFEVLDIPASSTVYVSCGNGLCMVADWETFIAKTYNLGGSFLEVPNPMSFTSRTDIQFTHDSTFYAVAYRTDTLPQTVVLRTEDAGAIWQLLFEEPYYPSVFYMHNDSFGFVGTSLGHFYKTTNHWQTTEHQVFANTIRSIYFLNDSVGLIGHTNGAMRTIDSGNNWNAGGFGSPNYYVRDFGQIDDSTIIATSSTNSSNWIRIFRSTDSGESGKVILDIKNPGRRISEIKCFPNGECIAVGKNTAEGKALVYRTLDGGDTWYEIEAPTSKMLYNLEFANDSIAFIGGEDGVLIRMNRNLLPPPPQDTTEDTITVIQDVSGNGHDVLIYPNPASNAQQVELNLRESSEVSHNLISIDGSLIRTQSFGNLSEGKHTFTIDMSNLPSGIYLHEIQLGEERLIKRFTRL